VNTNKTVFLNNGFSQQANSGKGGHAFYLTFTNVLHF